ncbi:MAG: FAD-binding oxidoreductase [Chthoniobacter sp.]
MFDRTEVVEFVPGKREVRLKTGTGHVIRAGHVVFATGYESQDFLPRRVVQLKKHLCPGDGKCDPLSRLVEAVPDVGKRPGLISICATAADGRILGGWGRCAVSRSAAARSARGEQDRAPGKAFSRDVPGNRMRVDYRWAGTFGETKDGLAYIGQIRQMPRCYFALGFGGNGITYSAIAAEIIREAMAGRQHSDAHLFRFDR